MTGQAPGQYPAKSGKRDGRDIPFRGVPVVPARPPIARNALSPVNLSSPMTKDT